MGAGEPGCPTEKSNWYKIGAKNMGKITYSWGYRQRLQEGSGLCHEPRLLGKALKGTNKTVLFSSSRHGPVLSAAVSQLPCGVLPGFHTQVGLCLLTPLLHLSLNSVIACIMLYCHPFTSLSSHQIVSTSNFNTIPGT